jgi:flagella basal body P-ring formation protein FlgA
MNIRLKILTFLSIVAFFLANTACGEKISVEIKDAVTLPEKQITLRDVAYISCNDVSLQEQISNIAVGNTPWPGNIRKIEKDIILARLVDVGIGPNEIVFGGANYSLVSVESITITGEEILKTAKEFLLLTLSYHGNEAVIESDRTPRDLILPASEGDISMEVSQTNTNKTKGNVQLIVRIFSNNKLCQKVPVFFNVKTYEDVAVSTRKINRNDILGTEDIEIKRMDTTNMQGTMFCSVDDLVGKRALRTLQPNFPLTAGIVDNPPLIKKGDLIRVLVRNGNLHIVMKGVAKEDGYAGKLIKVKNMDTKKELCGVVEDSDTVKVSL